MRTEPAEHRATGLRHPFPMCAAALLIGLALGGLLNIGGQRGSGANDPGVAVAAAQADGVPVGWPSSCDGAVAAAASYLQALGTSELALDLKAARRAVNRLATPDLAARLRPALAKAIGPYQHGAIGQEWRSGIDTLQATLPLAYQQRSCEPEHQASVRLWAVTLRGTAGSVWPMQFWDTHQVDLTWSEEDWKVSGGWQRLGPVPHWTQTPKPHRDNQAEVMRLARNLHPFRLAP